MMSNMDEFEKLVKELGYKTAKRKNGTYLYHPVNDMKRAFDLGKFVANKEDGILLKQFIKGI